MPLQPRKRPTACCWHRETPIHIQRQAPRLADHITYVEQHHVAHDHLAHKLAHFNSDDEPDLHTHFDHDSHIGCHHNTNI